MRLSDALWRTMLAGPLLTTLLASAALAQPTLLDPGDLTVDPSREQLSTGEFAARAIGLSPCRHTAQIGFTADFAAPQAWSGRFRVLHAGRGDWDLVIFDSNGVERFRRKISDSDVAAPELWGPGLIPGPVVRIQLQGPGNAASLCPRVRLQQELQVFGVAKPRGQVGDKDDRWLASDSSFLTLADAPLISQWSSAVMHVLAMSPGGRLLPCTGFFVAPSVFLTAAHCIRSSRETPGSIVYMGNQPVTGGSLKHLATDLALDFTVLWVNPPTTSTTLAIGTAPDASLVLWQYPLQPGPHVSVEQCVAAPSGDVRLPHKCDSSIGTSGAPLQSRKTGAVVAVHIDGCTHSHATTNCVNHGVRIEHVQARIKALAAELQRVHPIEAPHVLSAFGLSIP